MPRAALKPILVAVLALLAAPVVAVDPHLDRGVVPGGCEACHEGHGASRSPMLPAPQAQVCLACHGSSAKRDAAVRRGILSATARPTLLSTTLAQSSVHPISSEAYSRREPGVVTCTSCHSPHRSAPPSNAVSGQKPSPRHLAQREFELCESCHGGNEPTKRDPSGISQRFDPRNESFHPVEAPSLATSPSLRPELSGQLINCTDCHGNSDPGGVRGPHGSAVRSVLRVEYSRLDGHRESDEAYALCYECHDRERVLDSPLFPEHRRHVVRERTACATCHEPHGAVGNRALIRFGEESFSPEVSPSALTGRLAFESAGPGRGTCYLTCHGHDHAPAGYDGRGMAVKSLSGRPKGPKGPGKPGKRVPR